MIKRILEQKRKLKFTPLLSYIDENHQIVKKVAQFIVTIKNHPHLS